jgi:ferredoxin
VAEQARLEIRIDAETCIGSGNCAFWLPDVFDQEESGIAYVKDPAAAPLDKVMETARNCPTGSISVWRGDERLA